MADRDGFQVVGLREVVRDLEAVGVAVEDLKNAFAKIAEVGRQRASQHAPRRSGALASTIRGNRAKAKAVVAVGNSRAVRYAGPINYGWPARNIPADGFMQKADQEMRPIALGMLEMEINSQIRKRGLK